MYTPDYFIWGFFMHEQHNCMIKIQGHYKIQSTPLAVKVLKLEAYSLFFLSACTYEKSSFWLNKFCEI
jgi:hypothetical protein